MQSVVKQAAEVPAEPVMHGKKIVAVWTGKVTRIIDGDTCDVLDAGNNEVRVRLESIDSPEKKQAFGNKAKQHLSGLVFGKQIEVHETGKDFFGRTLAFLKADGVNVCEQMIADGMAWHYVKYSKSKTMAATEELARLKQVGLWADEAPVAPWTFRKKK